MQTTTPFHRALYVSWRRYLFCLLFALFAVDGVVRAQELEPVGRPATNRYKVIQLSTDPFASAAINARGQVAFITTRNTVLRAQFFDGRRVSDLGTLGGTNLTVAGLNDHGQAVFNVERNGSPRAVFYDGRHLRDLGTLGGPGATAAGLNERGQVAGTSGTAAGDAAASHVFRWSLATGMSDLGVPGQGDPVVNGINDKGHIFGRATYSGEPFPNLHGFFWSPRTGIIDIGVIGGFSVPTAMNDAGTIVGYGGTLPYNALGFRWTKAEGISDMGTLPDEFTWAVHINGAGKIVGATPFIPTTSPHPFLWTPGQGLLDLGTGTAERGAGTKINDHGMVIGYLFTGVTLSHGFIWTRETGLIEIGRESSSMLGSAEDVNNRGQVVGSRDGRAYRWTRNHGIVDLNTMIPSGPEQPTLRSAHAVSDSGSILATSTGGLYLLVPADGPHH